MFFFWVILPSFWILGAVTILDLPYYRAGDAIQFVEQKVP